MAGMLLLLMHAGQAQAPSLHQVQAVLDGLRSPQHAHQAAQVIGQQPGVRICRVDHNTRNLMLQVDPTCALTRAQVAILIAPLDMGVRCWERGPLPQAAFHHLDPRSCGEAPAVR